MEELSAEGNLFWPGIYLLSRLGRIPVVGDAVDGQFGSDAWRFTVSQMEGSQMEGYRIDEVCIRRLEAG